MTDSIEQSLPEEIQQLVPLVTAIMVAFNHIACLAGSLGQDYIQKASNDAATAFMADVGKMAQTVRLDSETRKKSES